MGRDPRGQRGASVSPPLSWKWCWLHSARIDLTTWYLKATKGLHTAPAERKTLLSLYPFRLLPRAAGAQKGVEKKKKKKRASYLDAHFSTIQVFKTHPYLCLSSAGRGFLCLFEYWKVTILLKNIIFKTVMTKGHRMHMLECHFLHSKRRLALFGYSCSVRRSPELSARWAVCMAFYSLWKVVVPTWEGVDTK